MTGADPRESFPNLLEGLTRFTDSEYGFIGEIRQDDEGADYLKTYAITDISWSEETKKFYDDNVQNGLEFRNLDTLFGHCVRTGELVIANNPANDPRRSGLPDGHPSLNSFLGIPLKCNGRMIGMAGIANRPGGYDEALCHEIEPLTSTISALVNTFRLTRQRDEKERDIAAILDATIEGICGVDKNGHITFVNDAAITLLGAEEASLIGKNFHEAVRPAYPSGNEHSWQASSLRHTLQTGDKVSDAFALFTKVDGGYLEVEYTCAPILKEGLIDGGVVTFKNIEKRRQSEREAQLARQKLAAATKDKERESFRLAMLVKNSPMCIHDIGLDGRLLGMNQAGLLIMGVGCEEDIIGLQYLDIPCKKDQPHVTKLFEEAKDGETAFFDFAAETKGGTRFFSSCFVPVKNEAGHISSIMGITEDITVHKLAVAEIQKQKDRLRAIIDSVPVMIFSKDEAGRYTAANQAIADAWGMTVEEVLGKTTAKIHMEHSKLLERSQADDRRVLETGEEICFTEERFVGQDGQKHYLQITKRRAPDGVFDGPTIIGNAVDITELKRYEEGLKVALERAEAASLAKTNFLSSVSHELRTPLNAVMGYAQLMQFDDLSEEQGKSVDEIILAAKKLTEKIDTLLYYGKISHRERQPSKKVWLKEFFDAQAKQMKPLMAERGIDFDLTISEDFYIVAAEEDMVELFTNLLANAVKYNKDEGKIKVTHCQSSERQGCICVIDTGVGFSLEHADRIFDPFERLEQRTSTIDGTGLGLSIAKEAADRMGAHITFDSEVGKGSNFYVHMDVHKEHGAGTES